MGEVIKRICRANKKDPSEGRGSQLLFSMFHPSVPVRNTDLGRNLFNYDYDSQKGAVLKRYCPRKL